MPPPPPTCCLCCPLHALTTAPMCRRCQPHSWLPPLPFTTPQRQQGHVTVSHLWRGPLADRHNHAAPPHGITTPPHYHTTMTPSHQCVDMPLSPPCPICEQPPHGMYVPPSPYASPTLTPTLPTTYVLPTRPTTHLPVGPVPTHSHTSTVPALTMPSSLHR